MIKKYATLMMVLSVAGAVGGPLAYFRLFDQSKASSQTAAAAAQPAGVTQAANYAAADRPAEGAVVSDVSANIATVVAPGAATQPAKLHVQDASSVFDFQITPEWVVAHWPTASTGLAQLQLEGYRVPLVTGTAQQDLAGSLTYYFNAQQHLQQITFLGSTGDPRPLIGLLSSRFQLTRRLVNDPGLVVYEAVHSENKVASSLRIRLAPLVQPGDPYRRYDIELSLERPE